MDSLDRSSARRPRCLRVVVSTIVVGACLYTALSRNYTDSSRTGAAGLISVVVGYWLRESPEARENT